jgi:Tfp pilus assembly protein PilX
MEKDFQKKARPQAKQGIILIVSALLLGVLLILGAYFLSFTLTESQIARSQDSSVQTYYLAEAGINEAIWKLKNDPEWKNGFETPPACSSWSASFSKSNTLLPNSSYQVQIQNSGCAMGEIISTAFLNLPNGKTAQRIVKTKVFKAMGSLTGNSTVFSGGPSENIAITASLVNIYDGNLFSNNHIDISLFSNVDVYDNPDTSELEGKAIAGGNLNVSWFSTLDSLARCAKNVCQGDCTGQGCPPSSISMPMIDFDSNDANSYKKKALAKEGAGQCSVLCNGMQCGTKCVYTKQEFEDLLWLAGKDGNLTLNNEITYVTGSIDLKGARHLTINGTLVADGTISIGENQCWVNKGKSDCGNNQVTISDPGVGKPSGMLTKGKINFGLYSSYQTIEMTGLVYANDEIRIISIPQIFRLTGGLLGRKVSIVSVWSSINFYLNNSIITEGIWAGANPPGGQTPPFSPVVTVEHWEEAY